MNFKDLFKISFKNDKKRLIQVILSFVAIILLIGIDQLTKYIASNNETLSSNGTITAIPYLLNFKLTFNEGAAWGIFSGKKFLLVSLSLLASIGFAFLVVRFVKFTKKTLCLSIAINLITAGTIGNLIDRAFYENGVIDFLQFGFATWFPIFNFADSCLTIGAIFLIIHVLFFYEDKKDSKSDKDNEISEDVDNA